MIYGFLVFLLLGHRNHNLSRMGKQEEQVISGKVPASLCEISASLCVDFLLRHESLLSFDAEGRRELAELRRGQRLEVENFRKQKV